MKCPKVSIVIPAYNVQEFIRHTLDSAINQTLDDIEIIVVDDASTDNTRAIISEYSAADDRVKLVKHNENCKLYAARKSGVEVASGKYLLFLDGDDFLSEKTCEVCFYEMEKNPVDIVHFPIDPFASREVSISVREMEEIKDFMAPYLGNVLGQDLLRACYCESKFSWNMCGKMYPRDLCVRVFGLIGDRTVMYAEDCMTFFVLAYLADSYRGIENAAEYRYRVGTGVSQSKDISLSSFDGICSSATVMDVAEAALISVDGAEYGDALVAAKDRVLDDVIYKFFSQFENTPFFGEAFDSIVKYWPFEKVVSKIARKKWFEVADFARHIGDSSNSLAPQRIDVKKIGIYYWRLSGIGGVESMIRQMVQYWGLLGYEVVLFSEESADLSSTELSCLKHIELPSFIDCERESYAERGEALKIAIAREGIDALVYCQWLSPIMMWDLLIIKSMGVGFVIGCFGGFNFPLVESESLNRQAYSFCDAPFVFRFADAVFCLSDTDRRYWSMVNDNVHCLPAPMQFAQDAFERSTLQGKTVLWIGRFCEEKRPLDAVRIMRRVADLDPEARLLMVGDDFSIGCRERVLSEIKCLNLENCITLCGYADDLTKYYRQASVFLLTSEAEGYPIAFLESRLSGIPGVAYDLPYLTSLEGRKGVLVSPVGDVNYAAECVLRLLNDADRRSEMGRDAFEDAVEHTNFDALSYWRSFFATLNSGRNIKSISETTMRLMQSLYEGFRISFEKRQEHNARVNAQFNAQFNAEIERKDALIQERDRALQETRERIVFQDECIKSLSKTNEELLRSRTWRVGKGMMAIPCKLKDIMGR